MNCSNYLDYLVSDGDLRFLDKDRNANERANYSTWWKEQINRYGTKVQYFVNLTSLSGHDQLYGEQPAAGFAPPQTIIIAGELVQSLMLGKWGLLTDDQSTFFVHISSFSDTFGVNTEPKSGDIFKLTELGNDRPGNRDGKIYEITERLDEEVGQINPLLGHYVWLLKAKRYEYSFEPGITPEAGSDQITDDDFNGILPGGTSSPSNPKIYTGSANLSAKSIFDYTPNGDDTSVYGDY